MSEDDLGNLCSLIADHKGTKDGILGVQAQALCRIAYELSHIRVALVAFDKETS